MNYNFEKPIVKLIGNGNFNNATDCMKRIEYAGRKCYQSTHKITDDSYKSFFEMVVKRGHESVLEHACFSAYISEKTYKHILSYHQNPFQYFAMSSDSFIYTGSVRAWRDLLANVHFVYEDLVESLSPMRDLFIRINKRYGVNYYNEMQKYNYTHTEDYFNKYLQRNDRINHRLITFEWISDRGITHELVRHRKMGFSQESSRYCSYNSSGEETTKMFFIDPFDYENVPYNNKIITNETKLKTNIEKGRIVFDETLDKITECYNQLKELGFSNDVARSILPNALKTNIVFSCYEDYLPHFFNLRCDKTAHYQIRELAKETERIYNNWIIGK